MKAIKTSILLIAVTFFSLHNQPLVAQEYDQALYDALEYRLVGPFRGGRSAAVTGVAGKPNLYYFG
ncbi:MAG: hypothetical protein ACI8RH_001094, partial [Flavobacteriales bacterium]